MQVFSDTFELPYPLETVFEFFNSPHNLAKITPGYMNFKLLTPEPIVMKEFALFDYKLRLFGVLPLRWTSYIDTYNPPYSFSDVQLRGPHDYWHHTHAFEAIKGGTRITDTIRYQLPFAPISTVLDTLLLSRITHSMFRFRRTESERIFSAS